MRWGRFVSILLGAAVISAPAQADPDDVRAWYVAMKKTAKYLRIAVTTGNDSAIPGLALEANDAVVGASGWNIGRIGAGVATPCRAAAGTLLTAAREAERSGQSAYRRAISAYPSQEDSCFTAMVSAERRR